VQNYPAKAKSLPSGGKGKKVFADTVLVVEF